MQDVIDLSESAIEEIDFTVEAEVLELVELLAREEEKS